MSLKQSAWYKFYGKETYLKAIEIFEVKRVNRQKAIKFTNNIDDGICQDIHLGYLINCYWNDRSNYRKRKIVNYCKECLKELKEVQNNE